MRLLVQSDAPGRGGAEISLANLVGALDPGIDVTVLGVCEEVVADCASRRPGVRAVLAPARRHPALVTRLGPDVLHANLCVPWAGAAALAAGLALSRTRVVAVQQLPLRTTDARLLWRTRALALRLDAHVAVGEGSCRRMEDFYALGRRSLVSIPNGVPDTGPLRGERPGAGLVVGAVGRLDPMKGFDVLLHAFVALPDDVRLFVLGEGEGRPDLERLARELGVDGRVELAGWHADPRGRLPEADVFCLPSRTEGFPLSVCEAMLAGLPVVATRVGSVAEAVTDGVTGLLADADDPHRLASALRRLRDDPVLRRTMGRAGREQAVRRHTDTVMAREYEALYERVLAAPRARRLRVGAVRA